MDWKELGKSLGTMGLKFIGGTLGGPTGAALGGTLARTLGLSESATPEEINQAVMNAGPETMVQLKTIESELEQAHLAAGVKHHEIDAGTILAVNETMQVEAQQGHPWSGAWRPFWGFISAVAFAIAVLGIFFLAGWCIKKGDANLLKEIPELIMWLVALFGIPGSILGVASWHRGQMQRIQAGEVKTGLLGGLSRVIK